MGGALEAGEFRAGQRLLTAQIVDILAQAFAAETLFAFPFQGRFGVVQCRRVHVVHLRLAAEITGLRFQFGKMGG